MKTQIKSVQLWVGLLIGSTAVLKADLIEESFTSDPFQKEWHAYGDTGLFHWNSTNANLEVTWDSSKQNSYFALPLGATLSRYDDFSLSFDLYLNDFTPGIDPQKPDPFQLSVAFINLAEATATNFLRGTGYNSPDIVEFSFFPDPGGVWMFGPSLTAEMCDWTATGWAYGQMPMALDTGKLFRISMVYHAQTESLSTTITRDGISFATLGDAKIASDFRTFLVDQIAVCSYSDAGQDPLYAGSILAHGSLDNFQVSLPPPPVKFITGKFTDGAWETGLTSRSNWVYSLERTQDLLSWSPVGQTAVGNGADIVLKDPQPPSGNAFYRVSAQFPK